MMKIAVNVLVDWIEHKVKGNRYDAQRWTRKKMQEETYEAMIIGGRKQRNGRSKKKFPTPRHGVSLFFSESVVRMVLCRRQRLSVQLSNLHVNMKERPALRL